MSRPVVMIVDPQAESRRALSVGLTEAGYEVVPVGRAADAVRFAAALEPWMVVMASELLLDASEGAELLELARATPTPILAVGRSQREASQLPDEVLFVSRAELGEGDLLARLRLLMLGRELGVEPNLHANSLVGDLGRKPFFELIPALVETRFTGQLQTRYGSIALQAGEPVAARTRRAAGLKAFCRLARHGEGPFRVFPDPTRIRRNLHLGSDELLARAVEDCLADFPDLRSWVCPQAGANVLERQLEPAEMEILVALHSLSALGELLDALTETDSRLIAALRRLESSGLLLLSDPEPTVAVVTDSTADLPKELAAAHRIHVVPLTVTFGDKVFLDGIDLSNSEFYELLQSSGDHPFTTPPSPQEFSALYAQLTGEKEVVSVHISSKLSETFRHSWMAAKGMLPVASTPSQRLQIQTVDSAQVTIGLGLQSLFAARMVERGLSAVEVAERLRGMVERMPTLFVVDTLEYLVRGGRIGRARALVGKLLGIKPVLGVVGGEIVAVDRGRGNRAAIERMMQRLIEATDPDLPTIVGVAHAAAPVWGDLLREHIEAQFKVQELIVGEMGPVVGAHVGPGAVGAVLFQPLEDEVEMLAPLR